MVSSVTSVPYFSYLNQLQGIGDTAANPPASQTSTSSTSTAKAGQAALASLLSNPSAFSPEVLGLLQSNTGAGVDSLLGQSSIGTTNPLTGLLDSLYSSSASAAVTQAADNVTNANTSGGTGSGTATSTSGASLISNLVNSYTQASVSYNNTNLQNSQNTVSANSFGPDGVTPLTV